MEAVSFQRGERAGRRVGKAHIMNRRDDGTSNLTESADLSCDQPFVYWRRVWS